jgi:hypothetical protein
LYDALSTQKEIISKPTASNLTTYAFESKPTASNLTTYAFECPILFPQQPRSTSTALCRPLDPSKISVDARFPSIHDKINKQHEFNMNFDNRIKILGNT